MELNEQEEGEVTLPPPVPVSVSYDRPRTKTVTPSSRDCSASKQVKYKECLRNHAVGMGGHATDGCGEFMPAGQDGTLDALKCAACNCHRNFHRRDGDHGSEPFTQSPHPFYRSLPVASGYGPRPVPHPLAHYPQPLHTNNHHLHQREEQEEEVVDHHGGNGGTGSSDGDGGSGMSAKKRFRTRFSQDQKDRMLEFAEKHGWRIQKHDEEAVQEFCMETGVRRHVLKVWMHNNKHTLGKQSSQGGGGRENDVPCAKVYNSEDGPKI